MAALVLALATVCVPTVAAAQGTGGGGPTDASQTLEIKRLILRSNAEQSEAFITGDPTVMQRSNTIDMYQMGITANQRLQSRGVTRIQLDHIDWGPITVSGPTATATTWETWTNTYSDGRTNQVRARNAYTLVKQNDGWLVSGDDISDVTNGYQTSPSSPATAEVNYETPNGRRTIADMRRELSGAGYSGPWDTESIVAAYRRTTAPQERVYQTPNGPRTLAQASAELQDAGYSGPWDGAAVLAVYTRTTAARPSAVDSQDPSHLSAGDVLKEFIRSGIQVASSGGPVQGETRACYTRTKGCTGLEGLQEATRTGVEQAAKDCDCAPIWVTGGTEPGHQNGEYSHAAGYKLDIRPTLGLNDYILTQIRLGTFKFVGWRGDGAPVVVDSHGNYWAYEEPSNKDSGPHWDVCFGGCKVRTDRVDTDPRWDIRVRHSPTVSAYGPPKISNSDNFSVKSSGSTVHCEINPAGPHGGQPLPNWSDVLSGRATVGYNPLVVCSPP